jgi:hypothetical protein
MNCRADIMAETRKREFFRSGAATNGVLGLQEKDGPSFTRDGYCRC